MSGYVYINRRLSVLQVLRHGAKITAAVFKKVGDGGGATSDELLLFVAMSVDPFRFPQPHHTFTQGLTQAGRNAAQGRRVAGLCSCGLSYGRALRCHSKAARGQGSSVVLSLADAPQRPHYHADVVTGPFYCPTHPQARTVGEPLDKLRAKFGGNTLQRP